MDNRTGVSRKMTAALAALLSVAAAAPDEAARRRAQAARVTIERDDWGIAHVHGRSDADAVFGASYAQAEDDFPRIERNYLTALGRLAEADGEGALWADLRARLYYDPADLQARYRAAPGWLKVLMVAWADGLNHYLVTHPQVRPKVLTRFEPWMALSFTEGSIGGDIERIELGKLADFYGHPAPAIAATPPLLEEPRGSNGIAIAPRNTANGRALLLINPHTSFYFRSELQMTSDQGLDAYGAATWGQFFIYQGFNRDAGWMHTSSGVDNVDWWREEVRRCPGDPARQCRRVGTRWLPLAVRTVTLRYRTADDGMSARTIPTYHTERGPIVGSEQGRWLSFAMMHRPVAALEQSWLRTKARDLAQYRRVAARRANSSNATLFADRAGEIAYLHPQFVPRRSDRFDWTRPVDGTDPAAAWGPLHPVATLPDALNPRTGWAMNTNNWPWTAAGADSPKAADFPRYMDAFGENARGEQALRLLTGRRDWDAGTLMAAAYDPYLTGFARLIPLLLADYDAQPADSPYRKPLAAGIALLRGWDFRWSAASTATSVAVFWGDAFGSEAAEFSRTQRLNLPDYIATRTSPARRLGALAQAVDRLTRDFGDWRVPWGRINRFQRPGDGRFDDAAPSVAVPFTSAQWGSLASFGAGPKPGTKRWYGTSGNSFVAVVEFGPRVKAWAVMAGGQSGDPASPHFRDQVERYAAGALRPVYFWPDERAGHVVRRYRPGDAASR